MSNPDMCPLDPPGVYNVGMCLSSALGECHVEPSWEPSRNQLNRTHRQASAQGGWKGSKPLKTWTRLRLSWLLSFLIYENFYDNYPLSVGVEEHLTWQKWLGSLSRSFRIQGLPEPTPRSPFPDGASIGTQGHGSPVRSTSFFMGSTV